MYKYSLNKKSTKHFCPQCKKKSFVRYIDNDTGEYLSVEVGRCDREINCGYHLPPRNYFEKSGLEYSPISRKSESSYSITPSFHNENVISVNQEDNTNNFIQFLSKIFDTQKVNKIINNYKIGTSHEWYSGTIFWQIDYKNRVRGGKIIKYDNNGKRTKLINWYHSLKLKGGELDSFHLKQCLFGEHLILKNNKPIAIVESEKTACIMSVLFEKYLWLASGSLRGLNLEKLKPLKNKKIVLYPDLGINGKNGSPFTIWNLKCSELKIAGFNVEISNLLEERGSVEERERGYDIADYFLENLKKAPKVILTPEEEIITNMYKKNENIKHLIDVFDLDF